MKSLSIQTYRFLFWFWLIALLFLTYTPTLPNPKIELDDGQYLRLDYVGHLVFYAVLVVLLFLWKRNYIASRKRVLYGFIVILLVGVGFAILNEVFQQYIPGRTYNPLDMFYNALGIVVGVIVAMVVKVTSNE